MGNMEEAPSAAENLKIRAWNGAFWCILSKFEEIVVNTGFFFCETVWKLYIMVQTEHMRNSEQLWLWNLNNCRQFLENKYILRFRWYICTMECIMLICFMKSYFRSVPFERLYTCWGHYWFWTVQTAVWWDCSERSRSVLSQYKAMSMQFLCNSIDSFTFP